MPRHTPNSSAVNGSGSGGPLTSGDRRGAASGLFDIRKYFPIVFAHRNYLSACAQALNEESAHDHKHGEHHGEAGPGGR